MKQKLIRFSITLGLLAIIFAVFALAFGDSGKGMMKGAFPFALLTLVHCIMWDLLDCNNGFLRFLRAVIFYGTAIFCTYLSIKYSFEGIPRHASQYDIYEPLEMDQKVMFFLSGSFPTVMVLIIDSCIRGTNDKDKFMICLYPILGLIINLASGFVVFFAAFILGKWLAKVILFILIGILAIMVFTFIKEGDAIYFYKERSYSGSKGSSGSSFTYSSSGDPEGDLKYYFSQIAMDNSRNTSICFGVYISCWVNQNFYYYSSSNQGEVMFTVRFDIDQSGLHAENENEMRMVKDEIESFKRSIFNDIKREANSLIRNVKSKHSNIGNIRVVINED